MLEYELGIQKNKGVPPALMTSKSRQGMDISTTATIQNKSAIHKRYYNPNMLSLQAIWTIIGLSCLFVDLKDIF